MYFTFQWRAFKTEDTHFWLYLFEDYKRQNWSGIQSTTIGNCDWTRGYKRLFVKEENSRTKDYIWNICKEKGPNASLSASNIISIYKEYKIKVCNATTTSNHSVEKQAYSGIVVWGQTAESASTSSLLVKAMRVFFQNSSSPFLWRSLELHSVSLCVFIPPSSCFNCFHWVIVHRQASLSCFVTHDKFDLFVTLFRNSKLAFSVLFL